MMDKQPIIETANNFDAVNEHIDNLAIRQRDLLNFQRLSKFRNFVISMAILLIALSVAYFIYSYATRLPTVVPSGKVSSIDDVLSRAKDDRRSDTSVDADSAANKVSVDFTVFTTIKLGDDENIVTGWRYNPSNLEVPNSEYCYYNLTVADNKREIINLAEKNQGEAIVWAANLSSEMQRSGEENCRFYK